MLEDIFVIKDLKMASTDTNWGLMVFSTNRDSSINSTVGESKTSDTKIKIFVKPYLEDTDGDGVKEMTNLRVSLSKNIAKDVLVPVADEYKFSFRYVDGKYRLFINEVQIGKDTSNTDYVKTFISAVNDFCENGNVQKCYISLKADGKNTAINIYKIKTDLDLRNSGEEGAGSASPLGINYINAPGAYYTGGDHGIDLEKNREKLVKEIQTFADVNNYPILVHCAVGRDRTGTISMLINGLLGVRKEDLYMDYELSFFSQAGSGDDPGIDHMVGQFEKMYNWIVTKYGDADSSFSECVEKFMLDIGVSQTEINNIREIMLEQ